MVGSVESKVDDLERAMTGVGTRLALVENDLANGTGVFARLEKKIDHLDVTFRAHMLREEKIVLRIGGWLIVMLAGLVVGLIVYVWKSHAG